MEKIKSVKDAALQYLKNDIPISKELITLQKENIQIAMDKYSNPFAILTNPAKEASAIMSMSKELAAGFKM